MNKGERGRRDLAIATQAAAGRSQADLAKRHGVCTRTIGRAIARVRSTASQAAVEEIEDRWHGLTDSIEELGQIRMASTSPKTTVAAIRLQTELARDRVELAQELSRPARCVHDAQVAWLVDGLLAAAEAEGVSPSTRDWLRATLTRLRADRGLPQTGHFRT